MDNKEQIKIDDITFDDVIGGSGVEMVDEAPVSEDKEAADSELDEEIEDTVLSQGDPGDEQVEKEVKEDVIEDDEEDDEEVDDTVVSEVLSKLGLELDTDGYDDTTDGLIKMTKDVGAKLAETKLDELFEAFPLVKNHLEYVMNGGESQQFMTAHDPNTDFDGLQIKEDNVRL